MCVTQAERQKRRAGKAVARATEKSVEVEVKVEMEVEREVEVGRTALEGTSRPLVSSLSCVVMPVGHLFVSHFKA